MDLETYDDYLRRIAAVYEYKHARLSAISRSKRTGQRTVLVYNRQFSYYVCFSKELWEETEEEFRTPFKLKGTY